MIYGRFVKEKRDLETADDIIRRVYEDGPGPAETEDGDEFILSAIVFSGASGEDEGSPAGAGRLLFDGGRFAVTEIAVLPEYRGRGYGDFLVRMLAGRAAASGAREVLADACAGTEDLFAGIGFVPAGEPFARAGGLWRPMRLALGGDRKCGGCDGRISL